MANINHPVIDVLLEINENLFSHVTTIQQELQDLQEDMLELEETLVELCSHSEHDECVDKTGKSDNAESGEANETDPNATTGK